MVNRVAIVTGASRGIGKELALALAKRGAAVVVAAKTMEPNPKLAGTIPDTVREIESIGGQVLGLQCDVRKQEDLERLVGATLSRFGRIDVLINNAGVMWIESLAGTPEKRLDLLMDINFRAPFVLSRLCVQDMEKRKWGHILYMSPPIEAEGLRRCNGKIAYMASKFSATLLAMGLARELEGRGIACNALWPRTLIKTAATANLGFGSPEDWRTSAILVDAGMAILEQDPAEVSGHALIDEDALRSYAGVTDFAPYRVVPEREPTPMDWQRWDKLAEEARGRYFAMLSQMTAAR
jgi:NAD(P)-dependent dehydrogenase (short-subunit alcohol dehydrogenase family)